MGAHVNLLLSTVLLHYLVLFTFFALTCAVEGEGDNCMSLCLVKTEKYSQTSSESTGKYQ